MGSFSVVSGDPADTARIASVLARRLATGDVVLLTGDLASGKTTFVKAVAAALSSPDVVTSPTFALAQFYATGRSPILHVDTYRLADVEEYRDLGLDEYHETSISLIEWGDKVLSEHPCHLAIRFERAALDGAGDDGDVRTISFSSTCDRWTAVLTELHDDLLEVAA